MAVEFKWNSHIKSTLLSSSNNDQNKVISLLIPTYIKDLPRLDTFKRTIESIVSMEIAPLFDCVIVDNSDKWIEEKKNILELSGLAFRYYKNDENLGLTGNWNRCVELAQQDVVSFVHDDDYLIEGFSNFVINYAARAKAYAFIKGQSKHCFNGVLEISGTKTITAKILRFLTHWIRKKSYQKCFVENPLAQILYLNIFMNGVSTLIYKDFIYELDGFSEKYPINADYHLAIKLLFLKGRYLITDDTTSVIDVTQSAVTKDAWLFEATDHQMKQEFIPLTRYPRITNIFFLLVRDLRNIRIKHATKSIFNFFGIQYLYTFLIYILAPWVVVKADKSN